MKRIDVESDLRAFHAAADLVEEHLNAHPDDEVEVYVGGKLAYRARHAPPPKTRTQTRTAEAA